MNTAKTYKEAKREAQIIANSCRRRIWIVPSSYGDYYIQDHDSVIACGYADPQGDESSKVTLYWRTI